MPSASLRLLALLGCTAGSARGACEGSASTGAGSCVSGETLGDILLSDGSNGSREGETTVLLQARVAVAKRRNTANDDTRSLSRQRRSRSWIPVQLQDLSICNLHLIDSSIYQSALDVSQAVFMPLFSSLSLAGSSKHKKIERAVIFLHGLNGNANSYFCDGMQIAKHNEKDASTLTLAPWFGKEQVTGYSWSDDVPMFAKSVYWDDNRWLDGGDSAPVLNSGGTLSSYGILDKIVAWLTALKDHGRLPNLNAITFAGFSAGCQLGSRWAFFSQMAANSQVQVVVGDCGSYMYLNSVRPGPSCVVRRDTGPEHECSDWRHIDKEQLGILDAFKYGLSFGTTNLVNHSYLVRFLDANIIKAAIDAYPSKNIRWFAGDEDVCNCQAEGYSYDPVCFPQGATCMPTLYYDDHHRACCDSFPDTAVHNVDDFTEPGMAQGSNRLQRNRNYLSYLTMYYKEAGVDFKPLNSIFNGGHDAAACFSSPHFSQWVYNVADTGLQADPSWPLSGSHTAKVREKSENSVWTMLCGSNDTEACFE